MAAIAVQIRCLVLIMQTSFCWRQLVGVCQIAGTIKSHGRPNGKQSGYVAGIVPILAICGCDPKASSGRKPKPQAVRDPLKQRLMWFAALWLGGVGTVAMVSHGQPGEIHHHPEKA